MNLESVPEAPLQVTVVVDTFRAFTTAAYVLKRNPASYVLTTKSSVIARLSEKVTNPLFIGKQEIGEHIFTYHIPNSPTRVKTVEIFGRSVFHRTAAGAKGVLNAKGADLVLAAAFTNATATVRTIQALKDPKVSIIPMGHEGETPSLEDEICAKYIDSLLKGTRIELEPYIPELQTGPGKYFFSDDQWQYPKEDFRRCIRADHIDFSIQAEVKDDYAILSKCPIGI